MKILMDNKYVKDKRTWQGKKPRTIYRITERGMKEFKDYYDSLVNFIKENKV